MKATREELVDIYTDQLPEKVIGILRDNSYPQGYVQCVIDAAYEICRLNIPQRDYPIGLIDAVGIIEDYIQEVNETCINFELIDLWHKIIESLRSTAYIEA